MNDQRRSGQKCMDRSTVSNVYSTSYITARATAESSTYTVPNANPAFRMHAC